MDARPLFPIGSVVLILCTLPLLTISGAEIVYRFSDPEKLSGKIEEITPKGIRLVPPKGDAISIDADDIREILWEGEPPLLRNSRNLDLAGKDSIAVEGYRKLLKELTPEQNNFREEAEFGIGRCLARSAESSPQSSQDAITQLNTFVADYPKSRHFYEAILMIAELHRTGDRESDAVKNYLLLKDSKVGAYPLQGELGIAHFALKKLDYDRANQAFQAVLDSPLKGAMIDRRRQEARAGLIQIRVAEQQPDRALQLANELVDDSPYNDSNAMAKAYLLRGNVYSGLGKNKEALFDYLHVDLLYPQEREQHAEALFRLSSLWNILRHPERATEAKDRLIADYPDSEWAKMK